MKRIALSLAFLFVCFNIASAVPQKAVLDFDGDNKTDYALVRNASNSWNWYIQRSMAGFIGQAWGTNTDALVPGDYDGDGKWDIAVWRPGPSAVFYILQSQTNTLRADSFGTAGDDPRYTQDFDGDGKADLTVTRAFGGGNITWYIQRSQLGFTVVTFGNINTDGPIRGDFDGDGKADVAVYRIGGTVARTFYVLRSTDGGIQSQTFGDYNTDYILPGDFDGDGKTDYAVYRRSPQAWYWLNSSDGSLGAVTFGLFSDYPVPGDYDGDGKTDQAVWRNTSPPTFYVNRSTLGFVAFTFGAIDDDPPATTLQVR